MRPRAYINAAAGVVVTTREHFNSVSHAAAAAAVCVARVNRNDENERRDRRKNRVPFEIGAQTSVEHIDR